MHAWSVIAKRVEENDAVGFEDANSAEAEESSNVQESSEDDTNESSSESIIYDVDELSESDGDISKIKYSHQSRKGQW
jgi:hypothetical protein